MYLNFIHSPVDGHPSFFHVLTIGNSAAMNIQLHVFFELWFYQGIYPVVGFLGHSFIPS